MQHINFAIYKFNHKTDYLPYFVKTSLNVDTNQSLLDIFKLLNQQQSFEYHSTPNFCVKINGFHTTLNAPLSQFVSHKTDTVLIEPISEYRVFNDLVINTKDFEAKFEPFMQYDHDGYLKKLYNENFLEYYASKTLEFNKDYIGEAALYVICELLEQKPALHDSLKNLCYGENGFYLHSSLKFEILDSTKNDAMFEKLIKLVQGEDLRSKTYIQLPLLNEIKQSFTNFNIGFYSFNPTNLTEFILASQANYVDLKNKNHPLTFQNTNENIDFKIAGKLLLEAVDSNVDFLLVNSNEDFHLLDAMQTKIASSIGREINLPIIKVEQFVQLLHGIKDPKMLRLDTHKVKINFL